jgi:coproporphyrinogen III oxidase
MDASAALEDRKQAARSWFEALQLRLIAAMEALEDARPAVAPDRPPGRFVVEPWTRVDAAGAPGGGGRAATLSGRLFEKMGVHVSTVHGAFAPEFAKRIPGADADPRFWASGVSVIAHPWSPRVPTVHMNARFVVTNKAWFGGGADLTPMLDARRRADDRDAVFFHETLRALCARHPTVASYERFKAWCDEYFFLPHRREPRGIGGIFFDDLDVGGDSADCAFDAVFAFARDLGETFAPLYADIVRRNFAEPWTQDEREEQLVRRGRYAEFNLLYDRGTTFGLKTSGNVAAILSSLPPLARWP